MDENILVSIIIPIYNVEKYLTQCLNSIINQTLKSIEIICINDGSTDNSLEILTNYSSNYENITVINQENKGQAYSRNIGINAARGKYIYFCDSDDFINIDLCEKCYFICENNDLDVLTFDANIVIDNVDINLSKNYYDRSGKNILSKVVDGKKYFFDIVSKNAFRASPCILFINRIFLIKNDLYFYEGIVHEDDLFTTKLILKSNRILHCENKYFNRRIRSDSVMTSFKDINNSIGYLIVAQELYKFYNENDFNLDKKLRYLLLSRISRYYSVAYSIIKYNTGADEKILKERIINDFKKNKEVYESRNFIDKFIMIAPKTFNIIKRIIYN